MKRGLKWSDGDEDGTSSSDDSSTPDANSEDNDGTSKSRDASHSSKLKASLQGTSRNNSIFVFIFPWKINSFLCNYVNF